MPYPHSISQNPYPGDRQEIAALWQEVFHDSDEFTNLFFSRVYKPENTLIIRKENRIIASLQMIPYEIKIDGNILPSAYVCGVCTHPSERGKGLMNRLMTEAMELMRQKNYVLSTLIPAEPWLFDFYKKFGYTHPVNQKTATYTSGIQSVNTHGTFISSNDTIVRQTNVTCYTFAECTPDTCFSFFDRKQRERRCTILHNPDDFETIIRDLLYDNGNAWIALKANCPVGIAFTKPEAENTIYIKEILYDNTPVKEALINHMLIKYNVQTAKIRLPFHAKACSLRSVHEKIQPYGLACILTRQDWDISDLYMTLMLD